MTPTPDPRSRRRSDEVIAILVALGSLGAIGAWSISQQNPGFNLAAFQSTIESATRDPLGMFDPEKSPAPASSGTITPAPSPEATASPQATTPANLPPQPAIVPYAVTPVPQVGVSPAPAATPSPVPTGQPTKFSDVPANFWASTYIAALSDRGIIAGLPNNSFAPNRPVTRAEFAEMLGKAFNQPAVRPAFKFRDVPGGFWATRAIDEAVKTQFMSGYPGRVFRPNQQIPRLEAQLALATGLNLAPGGDPVQVLNRYQDFREIPAYALPKIAAAVQSGLVVDYPNPNQLNSFQVTTRAEAATLIYKALEQQGKITDTSRQ